MMKIIAQYNNIQNTHTNTGTLLRHRRIKILIATFFFKSCQLKCDNFQSLNKIVLLLQLENMFFFLPK